MSKIRLRKVHYCTNYNFNTNRIENPVKFYTGYVVTRLMGTGDFYIPKTYNGLNVVGITWDAFEYMSDYMSGSNTYSSYECYPSIYIHHQSLLFAMLPKRYSNASRVYPIYFIDTVDGQYCYSPAGMTYNQNDNILSYLLESFNVSYNAGYSVSGKISIDKVVYGRRYKADTSFGITSSSEDLNNKKACFDYFEYPYFTWSEIRDVLFSKKTGLAFCRVAYHNSSSPNEVAAFAYNFINGYETDLDCSKPDIFGTKYHRKY